jgi:large subunit ribosomal protein L32
MANPKRKHSNMRTRLRRTHDALAVRSLSTCKQCGALVLPHRICGYCGYYKGRLAVTIKTKEEKKAE